MNLITSKPPLNIESSSQLQTVCLKGTDQLFFKASEMPQCLEGKFLVENSHPIYAWCPAPHNSLRLYYIKIQLSCK